MKGTGLMGLKNDIVSSLKRRYPSIEDQTMFAFSTLLDPRFKTVPFMDQTKLKIAKGKLVEEMCLLLDADGVDPNDPPCQGSTDHSSRDNGNKEHKGFWTHYNNAFGKNTENPSFTIPEKQVCETELNQYLKEPNIDATFGGKVPSYWYSSPYKRVQKMALKYLCIPPTTVYSERLFSTAGNICDTKRNRLDPERVKMLVFLNKNIE